MIILFYMKSNPVGLILVIMCVVCFNPPLGTTIDGVLVFVRIIVGLGVAHSICICAESCTAGNPSPIQV